MAKRQYLRTGLDLAVRQHAIGANAHTVTQDHAAFKQAIDINVHIGATHQGAAHVDTRRVLQAHALGQQVLRYPVLVSAFEFSQMLRAVHASHFERIARFVGQHLGAFTDSNAHHIGQVKLFLRIVLVQLRYPALEQTRRRNQDATINLANGALGLAGVLVLDDGLHRLSVTHDAPVAGGVGQIHRQQRQVLAGAQRDQGLQGRCPRQRYIPRQNEHLPVVRQRRYRHLHRVAGAKLRFLPHKMQSGLAGKRGQSGLHLRRAVASDHHHRTGMQRLCRRQHMARQRHMGQHL